MQGINPTYVMTSYIQGNNFLQLFVDVRVQYNKTKHSYHSVSMQGDIFHSCKVCGFHKNQLTVNFLPLQMHKMLFMDQDPFQPGAFDIIVYCNAALQDGPAELIKCPYLALCKDS